MSCFNCTSVNLICCSDEIILGTAPDPLETYWVRITDITNGRKLFVPADVVAGMLIIDSTEIKFAENHSYEIHLSLQSNPNEFISWDIDGTEVECLMPNFEKIYDENKELVIVSTQTVKL